jgi:hypothetical protein
MTIKDDMTEKSLIHSEARELLNELNCLETVLMAEVCGALFDIVSTLPARSFNPLTLIL